MTNLGNVVGLVKGIISPLKKYIFWARIFNVAYPDETIIYQWSKEDNDWIPFSLAGVWFLPPVIDQRNNPPVSPAIGDKYLVGTSPTGVWASKANNHAVWTGNQWTYTFAKNGSVSYKKSSGANYYCFNGTIWTYQTPAVGDYLSKATNVQTIDDTGIADGEIAIFDLTNKKIKTSDTTISTDGTMASNSDAKLPTEKAINTKLENYQLTYEKGAINGYAGLDGLGKVPASQLPSYVDDVLEYANFSSLPSIGEYGKIYITLDNNKQYRWSGSTYIELVASPGTTDAVPEGDTNLYFLVARVLATALTGISFASSLAVTAADTLLVAVGKLQAQINNLTTNSTKLITSTQSGSVGTKIFYIAHGLGTTPTHVTAIANSADATGITYVSADATNVIINYAIDPPTGINNLKFSATAK